MTQEFDIAAPRKLVLLISALTVAGLGAAAAFAPIDSAVLGSGTVKVEGAVKEIQHPDGGIVAALPVRDGDLVAAGDLVLRLDAQDWQADLQALQKRLVELSARRLRLIAERDSTEMTAPTAAPAALSAYQTEVLRDETALLAQRRDSRHAQISQLEERIAQLASEEAGQNAQLTAAERARALLALELADLRALQAKELVPMTRLRALEREEADLEGTIGALVAEGARTAGRRSEMRLQILQLTQDSAIDVLEELRRVETEATEIARKIVAAEGRLARSDLFAPVAGRIHATALHTKGGVLAAGTTAMVIVPEDEQLLIEVRIAPTDIDQVYLGQPARLRLSAFNQRTTPEITGEVTHISADLSEDPQTGATWYALRVRPDTAALAGLGDLKLKPGMPTEVFLLGHSRTILSYLIKPMSDHLSHALREN